MRFLPLLLALFFVSQSASAADYKWTVTASGWPFEGGSPTEACQKYADWYSSYIQTWKVSIESTLKLSDTRFRCYFEQKGIGPNEGQTLTDQQDAFRSGDSCPSGSTYNDITGACDAPSNPCLAKKGQTTKWAITGNTNDPNPPVKKIASTSLPGKDYYVFTRPPVIDGCEVNTLGSSNCIFKADGIFACAGVGQYTGEQLTPTADTVPESVDIQPQPGEASQESDCTSWTEDAEGRRHMTCNVTTEQTLEGGSQCGEVNGEWQCIKPSPKPESTKNASTQKITEETLAGGDKKKTTETTVNKTYCAEGACTTTTTKTTNVTITGSDGSTKSSTDSCTGAGCGKPSQPDEQKPPEEEKPEPSATGLACTEAVSCTGDAVQCAMLRTEKEQKCNAEKAGDYNEYKDEIEQAVSGDQFQMEEGDEDISALLSNVGRFLPSSCPAPIQINTNLAGTVSLPLDQLCSFAEIFGHFFVAFAGLFFIRQIAASDGGA